MSSHIPVPSTPRQHARWTMPTRRQQAGLTLVELLVGIALGLLVVAVGIGALLVSRGYSGSVSEATQLQQQAAYAMRVLGQQIRQAGALELKLGPNHSPDSETPADPADPVAFTTGYYTANGFGRILNGKDAPNVNAKEYTLIVGHQNYREQQVASTTDTMFRDCLGKAGAPDNSGRYRPILSHFVVRTRDDGIKELVCAGAKADGSPGTPQPIIENVADFQVRYHLQEKTVGGNPTIKQVDAAGVADKWGNVFAVEVCLDLVGRQKIGLPSGAEYTNCAGNKVNLDDRLHQVFRSVYQIRSQGIMRPS